MWGHGAADLEQQGKAWPSGHGDWLDEGHCRGNVWFLFCRFLMFVYVLMSLFSYVWSKCSLSSYVLLMLHMPTQAFRGSGISRGTGLSVTDSVVPMLEILKNEELHWRSANKVLYSCISILYMYMCSSVFTWFLLICSFVLTCSYVHMFFCLHMVSVLCASTCEHRWKVWLPWRTSHLVTAQFAGMGWFRQNSWWMPWGSWAKQVC